jgi:hypothetical protein
LALTYSYQAIITIAGLLLAPLCLSTLGQHDDGLWLVATQLLTYLTLTDLQALGCTTVVSTAYLANMIPNVMRSPLGAYLRPTIQQFSRRLRGACETVAVG